jgi:hypothetical protein
MAGLLNFTPTNYASLMAPGPLTLANAAVAAAGVAAVPGGGGPTLVVTNLGPSSAVVALGTSATSVPITLGTGLVIPAGQSVSLGVGANTYIAANGTQGIALLNLAQGT